MNHNVAIFQQLHQFQTWSLPVLVGPSRKTFIGQLTTCPVHNRLGGTIAACCAAYRGGARIFRVHDVGAVKQALRVFSALS